MTMKAPQIYVARPSEAIKPLIRELNQKLVLFADENNNRENDLTDYTVVVTDSLDTLETSIDANSSAITSIDARVTVNEADIVTSASAITALESTVNDPSTGVSANATAISSLETEVSIIDGEVTANTSSITSLTATVGSNTSAITAEASARATADGYLEGKYTLTATAGDVVTGMNITSASGGGTNVSDFTIQATTFKIYDGTTGQTPFYTSGGNVYMDNAFITNLTASNITANTITANEIQLLGVTTSVIANDAVSTLASGSASTTAMITAGTYDVCSCSASGNSNYKALITVSCYLQDGTGGSNNPQVTVLVRGNSSGTLSLGARLHTWPINSYSTVSFHFPVSSIADTQYTFRVQPTLINGTGNIKNAVISCVEFKK